MIVIPPVIGVILILVGIVLFIIDLNVTNHGLLIAGGIVTLLAGGLALFGAGVPYSGVLLGAVVVAAMLMGGALRGSGFFAGLQREAGSYGQGGDDRRGWHRKESRGSQL
jgi:membrane-bound serine protease (ClpP class)